MNLRPSGYEPDELPGCSTPRVYGSLRCDGVRRMLLRALPAWQRPTLPRLETKYHRRRGFSRPSSGWDRVFAPRHDHQAGEARNIWNMTVMSSSRDAPLQAPFRDLAAARDAGNLFKPIERLGPVSSTHCCASTPGLSTWWSSTALERDLVLRWVSRLDAFSGYPVRT